MSQGYGTAKLSSSACDSQEITFLPVNQRQSPKSTRTRRVYQSCDNCREKKKKCQPSSTWAVCLRCQQESRDCLTTHRRRRRKVQHTVSSATLNSPEHGDSTVQDLAPTAVPPLPLGDIEDTLPEDKQSSVTDPGVSTARIVSTHCADPHWGLKTNERILSTHILDARDALDLVAVTGTDKICDLAYLDSSDIPRRPNRSWQPSSSTHPDPDKYASAWDRFFLVRRGIIQAREAVEYWIYILPSFGISCPSSRIGTHHRVAMVF